MKKMLKVISFFSYSILLLFVSLITVSADNYISNGVNITYDWGYQRIESTKGFDSMKDNNRVYRVTDAGRLASSQPEFIVDLTEFGLSEQGLFHGAYQTIVVIFEITMKEVNDGYQELYLINTGETSKGNLVTPYLNFEHGSNFLKTTYQRYEFYAEFTGTALCSTEFSICFSAHGNNSDDWLVGNVVVQICTSSESKKVSSLTYITNASTDSCWPEE